jgi:hypothetical protein
MHYNRNQLALLLLMSFWRNDEFNRFEFNSLITNILKPHAKHTLKNKGK